MKVTNKAVDKIVVLCSVLFIVVTGIILFQSFQQPKEISERVALIQNDAQSNYDIKTYTEKDDHVLFFEIADGANKNKFEKDINSKLRKYNIASLY